jgi:hypothetical protein
MKYMLKKLTQQTYWMEAGAVIQFLKIDYQRIFQLTLILIGLVISISNIFEWRLFKSLNCISGIMVSMLVSSAVDRGCLLKKKYLHFKSDLRCQY